VLMGDELERFKSLNADATQTEAAESHAASYELDDDNYSIYNDDEVDRRFKHWRQKVGQSCKRFRAVPNRTSPRFASYC
jgi:hypothetical protein